MFLKHVEGLTAVNARRHTDTLYLSSNWSVEGFMESVKEYVKENYPEDFLNNFKEPSVSTVQNAFLPSNSYVGSNLSTHRIHAVRKLTTKQNHKKHIDTHACNALRRSVKDQLFLFSQVIKNTRLTDLLSLQYYNLIEQDLRNQIDPNKKMLVRQAYRYISCDDKAKIPIGEPYHPISTGVRQKIGNIVPVTNSNALTQVLDHDFGKASLTPSVELDITTPEKREMSWFDGYAHFVIHCSIFSASNGWYHAVNLIMRIIFEGSKAANILAPKSLKDFLELNEGTKKKILFYTPYYLVLSTDGKFIYFLYNVMCYIILNKMLHNFKFNFYRRPRSQEYKCCKHGRSSRRM